MTSKTDEGNETPAASKAETPTGQKERIVAAAILQDGVVYTGTRHGFIIRDIVLMTGTKPVTGQQGFVTSKGEFVSREIAGEIALRAGQVASLKYSRTQLFSEDVWDIPSGLEFNEKELSALLSPKAPVESAARQDTERLLEIKEQAYEWAAGYPLEGDKSRADDAAAGSIYHLCEEYDKAARCGLDEGGQEKKDLGVTEPDSAGDAAKQKESLPEPATVEQRYPYTIKFCVWVNNWLVCGTDRRYISEMIMRAISAWSKTEDGIQWYRDHVCNPSVELPNAAGAAPLTKEDS